MPSRSPASPLSRTSLALVNLAEALSRSGSHLEDAYWEACLGEALDKSLGARQARTVEAALDHMLDQRSPGYDLLVELAEAHSESLRFTHEGQDWDALLISAPCLAWTRYQLPAGKLRKAQHQQLGDLLTGAVLAPGAHACLLPDLMRFDNLPQSFQETRAWTQALALRALGRHDRPTIRNTEAPEDLLADAYFLVGVVVVPHGQALFQWQSAHADPSQPTQESVTALWSEGCARILEPVFTGCRMEYLSPQAYYSSTRHADQNIRPLTVKAALTWLQTAAHIPAADLRAAIVACGEPQVIEEYRIGFCTRQNNDVIYGCVWPALSREESMPEQGAEGQADTWDTITALLRESGIQDIRRLPGTQAMEFCEDCGTPYFPNMLGEMQHPELPEEIDPEPVQFH